jgi:hypothetical protein
MLCGCMKSMLVSLPFGLKLPLSLLMLKPTSHLGMVLKHLRTNQCHVSIVFGREINLDLF